jgi:hypothetical protein
MDIERQTPAKVADEEPQIQTSAAPVIDDYLASTAGQEFERVLKPNLREAMQKDPEIQKMVDELAGIFETKNHKFGISRKNSAIYDLFRQNNKAGALLKELILYAKKEYLNDNESARRYVGAIVHIDGEAAKILTEIIIKRLGQQIIYHVYLQINKDKNRLILSAFIDNGYDPEAAPFETDYIDSGNVLIY